MYLVVRDFSLWYNNFLHKRMKAYKYICVTFSCYGTRLGLSSIIKLGRGRSWQQDNGRHYAELDIVGRYSQWKLLTSKLLELQNLISGEWSSLLSGLAEDWIREISGRVCTLYSAHGKVARRQERAWHNNCVRKAFYKTEGRTQSRPNLSTHLSIFLSVSSLLKIIEI